MFVRSLPLASLFDIEVREYANITVTADTLTTARNVILGFAIGILIAALAAFYHKTVPGRIVRSLLRAEALSEESAKTPEDLGLARNFFYKYELAHNVTLKKLIRRTETAVAKTDGAQNGETEEEGKETGATEVRYYIPEEDKYRADVRYERKGSGPIGLAVTAVLTIAAAILLIRLIPSIFGVIDNLMG